MLTAGEAQAARKRGLRALLEWLDAHPIVLFPFYLAAYFGAAIPGAHRALWYDELFTYYVSTSASVHEFLGRILHIDLNPPLSYVFVAISMRIFGDNLLAVRLPSIAAYLVASVAVFFTVRRRLGGLFGLAAMVLVWSTGFFWYAAEARPYALVLAFFAFALLCWDRIQPGGKFTAAHWGLSASLAGMLLSHCYAAFFVAPFVLGQLARDLRGRALDRRAWTAILMCSPLVLSYIPLVIRSNTLLLPPEFLGTWLKGLMFYLLLPVSLGPASFLVLPLLVMRRRADAPALRKRLEAHDIVFIITTLAMPVVILSYTMWTQAAFWRRYGIGVVIGFTLGLIHLVAHKTNRSVAVGAVAAVVTLATFCVSNAERFRSLWRPAPAPAAPYRLIHPELPFVTASGITFLEMDHREPPEFVKRLYFVTDREAALKYSHATVLVDGIPILRRNFPMRATVAPYRDFVATHDRFLVLATPGHPEEWLLDKLKDDGAEIKLLAEIDTHPRNTAGTGYWDTMVYEVRVNFVSQVMKKIKK